MGEFNNYPNLQICLDNYNRLQSFITNQPFLLNQICLVNWKYTKIYFYRIIPLFRILLPFAIGILIGINGVISDLNIWKLFFLGLLFYVVLNFFLPKTILGRNIEAVLIKFCFLFFGLLHVHLSNFSNQAAFIQPKLTNENLFCKVVSDPIHTKKSWKFFVELIGKSELGDIFGCKSKVLVSIKDSVMKPNLEYGDYLLINSKLLTIKPPDLEGQFDYGNFLRSKNCFFQSFIRATII